MRWVWSDTCVQSSLICPHPARVPLKRALARSLVCWPPHPIAPSHLTRQPPRERARHVILSGAGGSQSTSARCAPESSTTAHLWQH